MVRSILLLSGVSLIVAASPASIAPTAGKPKWVVDYAENFCILSRQRDGDQPGVAFRTRPLADQHDLLLFLPPTKEPAVSGKGELAAGRVIGTERWVAADESKDKANRLVDTTLTSQELDDVAAAGWLRITISKKLDAAARVPGMRKALTALHACEDDLALRWQVTRGWVVPPKPVNSLHDLFTSREYPSQSFSRGNQGGVRVLLSIDPGGGVSDCRTIQTSGDAKLDEVPCRVFRKHARFHPALNAQGKPVAGNYVPPQIYFSIHN